MPDSARAEIVCAFTKTLLAQGPDALATLRAIQGIADADARELCELARRLRSAFLRERDRGRDA